MLVEFLVLAILGLKPDWQPEACERAFATDGARASCEADRNEGAAWALELAGYIAAEAERQSIDPLLMVAVAYRESRLETGDVCRKTIEADRIASREALGEDGRERIEIRKRSNPDETVQVVVTVIEESPSGSLLVDRCSAGEMGTFQLINSEARAGDIVPATGQELPRNARERRLVVLGPQVNTSLAAVALSESRDWACKVVDEDDRDICEQDWTRWVGTYNTGRRSGTAFDRYTSLVSASYRKAQEYACERTPDFDLCSSAGGDEPVEDGADATDQ